MMISIIFIVSTITGVLSAPLSNNVCADDNHTCLHTRALALTRKSEHTIMHSGTQEMLELAILHSKTMASKQKPDTLAKESYNSGKHSKCGTFISTAYMLHADARVSNDRRDPAVSCAQQWMSDRRKGGRKFRENARMHAVFGVYVEPQKRHSIWCTVLTGMRTKFSDEGSCARISVNKDHENSSQNEESIREIDENPYVLTELRLRQADSGVSTFVLVCDMQQCKYCMKSDLKRCYSERESIRISNSVRRYHV